MTELPHTQGEILFEQYLSTQNLPFEFEKEHPGKRKRVDYTIEWNGQTVVFDVKDFDPPEKSLTGFGYFDPYTRIREKIEQGREKFTQYKEYCCGLVLHNAGQPFVSLHEPDIMGAMYGDSGFTFPVDTSTGVGDASQLKRAFLGRGKMIRPKWSEPQNTTIAAIITVVRIQPHYLQLLDLVRENPRRDLAEYEAEIRSRIPDYDPAFEVPRVIVWHNAVARIPFPEQLFCGNYDTHFGIVRVEDGEVEQDVTFEGSAVPSRLRLLKPRQHTATMSGWGNQGKG
jgi:hypothetical protein